MIIKEVFYKDVWHIRRVVMYPERDLEYIKLPEDEEGIHLGLYLENELVSVISLFINGYELQFRKFATLVEKQGHGYGTKLLEKVLEYAKERKIKRVWCNSRVEKIDFYKKFGFSETKEKYIKDEREFVIIEKILV